MIAIPSLCLDFMTIYIYGSKLALNRIFHTNVSDVELMPDDGSWPILRFVSINH